MASQAFIPGLAWHPLVLFSTDGFHHANNAQGFWCFYMPARRRGSAPRCLGWVVSLIHADPEVTFTPLTRLTPWRPVCAGRCGTTAPIGPLEGPLKYFSRGGEWWYDRRRWHLQRTSKTPAATYVRAAQASPWSHSGCGCGGTAVVMFVGTPHGPHLLFHESWHTGFWTLT
jgi:hypothetical protein